MAEVPARVNNSQVAARTMFCVTTTVMAHSAVAEAMGHLAGAGLLDLHGDPAMAAAHFMALTTHTIVQFTHYGVLPLPPAETDRLVGGGVAAFLRAYGGAGTGPTVCRYLTAWREAQAVPRGSGERCEDCPKPATRRASLQC